MFFNKKRIVFMDYASGTPIDKSVLREMSTLFSKNFFNPSSIYHEGVSMKNKLISARDSIADVISARSSEIIFTDGGTEANNLVIRGLVSAWHKDHSEEIPHIITSKIEHASILETCRDLEEKGLVKVDYISVDKDGIVDIKEIKKKICESTILVSIGFVNGEIGTIQDIRSIAKIVRYYRKHKQSQLPYFHTDAVQAANYLDINVQKLGVDFMTINASKIYGPKKIAFLYKKSGIDIDPIITGGSQEFGLRAGTENIPYIIGLSKALFIANNIRDTEFNRLKELQLYMENLLIKEFGNSVIINGQGGERIPNIINISIKGLSVEEILLRLDANGIMVSMKSACKSDEFGDSHVIMALRDENTQSIRFSFGRNTEKRDIDYTVNTLIKVIHFMRSVSKTYLY